MAPLPHRPWRHDERVRHVQRPGNELFTAAAGDGMGWDAPESVWKNEQADECAVGGDFGLRGVLGAVSGAWVQQTDYTGYPAVRVELVAGVCDAGGAAHSRAEPKARIQSAGRIGGRGVGRSFPGGA